MRKRTKTEPTWIHRWQLGRIDVRTKKRAARDERREKTRAARAVRPGDRTSLAVTIVTIVLSVAVAIPSQADWFLGKLAHGMWSDPNAWRAIANTLLIEVLCWLCAILYARTVRDHPVRIYRVGTFVFAGTAAWINYDHGREISFTIGVVSALGSLMGVGAFELYMHRARNVASGLSLPEIRMRARRWRTHPLVMREAGRIQATFGLALPHEVAFRMAYLRRIGNPTLPVAITSPRLADAPKPELPKRKRGASRAAEATVELPVDWSCPSTFEELVGEAWPTPGAELGGTAVAAPERKPEPPRDRPKPASSSASAPSAPAPKPASAPMPTSAVPPERKPSRNLLGGLSRNSEGSGRVQFAPTAAELTGGDTALDRIGRYLARAEREGQSLDALDRKYIAGQFNVSDRQVRNSVKAYNAAKAEGK